MNSTEWDALLDAIAGDLRLLDVSNLEEITGVENANCVEYTDDISEYDCNIDGDLDLEEALD